LPQTSKLPRKLEVGGSLVSGGLQVPSMIVTPLDVVTWLLTTPPKGQIEVSLRIAADTQATKTNGRMKARML
jgi:hypothetical protein